MRAKQAVSHPSANLADICLKHAFNRTAPFIHQRSTEPKILKSLKDQIDLEVSRLTDDDFADQFMQSCPVDGTDINDYRNHEINLGPGKKLITGIRFKSLDLNSPFVGIGTSNFSIQTPNELKMVVRCLKDHYEIFRPKWVQFFAPLHSVLEHHDLPYIQADQHFLAGLVDELKAMPKPDKYDEVQLEAVKDFSFMDRYSKTFDELSKSNPLIHRELQMESEASFTDSFNSRLLFQVYTHGEWAGIIAAEPDAYLGMTGYNVREEILAAPLRGQSLGPAIQRQLIERLDSSDGQILFGSIHSTNIPSLKTALRCGRKIVGTFYFAETGE